MAIKFLDEEPATGGSSKIRFLDEKPKKKTAVEKTEESISKRPNRLEGIGGRILGNLTQPGAVQAMNFFGDVAPSIEGAVAAPLMELQTKGILGIQSTQIEGQKPQLGKAFLEGVTQQRPVERGDIFRNAGLGDTSSSILGVMSDPLALLGPARAGTELTKAGGKQVGKPFVKLGRNFNKAPKKTVTERASALSKQAGDVRAQELQNVINPLEAQKAGADDIAQRAVFNLTQQGKEARRGTQGALARAKRSTADQIDVLKTKIQGEVDNLAVELDKKSFKNAKVAQKKAGKFFKGNSKAYGQKLDDIASTIAESGEGGVTRGQAADIMEKTIQDAVDSGIETGPAFNRIKELAGKYKIKFTGIPGDEFAGKKPTVQFTGPDDVLDFKAFVKDVRSVQTTLSSGAKRGATRFTPEDVVVSLFKKHYGDFVSEYVPELKQLNKAYGPVIDSMKFFQKTFKPYGGTGGLKSGSQFLAKAAKGKITEAEKQALKSIEKGSKEFGKGIGDISSEGRKIGRKIGSLKKSLKTNIDKFKKAGKSEQESIKKALQERLDDIQASKLAAKEKASLTKKATQEAIDSAKTKTEKDKIRRFAVIEKRKFKVLQGRRAQTRRKNIVKGTAFGASAGAGAYLAFRGILKGGGERR